MNRKIPMIDKQTGEPVWVSLKDVDFVSLESKKIIYHVGEKDYRQLSTLDDFAKILVEVGFIETDRGNLVNMERIKKFDEEYGVLYFEENPTSKSQRASIARIHYSVLGNLVKRCIAENTGKTLEFKDQRSEKIGFNLNPEN
jgi:DNA-binding LytR/AlgR family response regulator